MARQDRWSGAHGATSREGTRQHRDRRDRGRLGLSGGGVSTAIGYLAPKLIGQLTPGGVIPSGIPAAVSGFLGSTAPAVPRQTVTRRVEQVAPIGMTVIHDAPHLGRWLIPLLAGLGILGLFWYLLSGTRRPW